MEQVTRIEKPKERDANKEMDRPVKDEIEVVHLKDGSRRRNFRPLSIRPDNNQLLYAAAVKNSDEGRVNGYSNGYGSASDMEINEPDDEADDPSDDANDGNLDDLPMPPSPPRKVNTH